MSCKCLKIASLKNDVVRIENALRCIANASARSDSEISSNISTLTINMQCVTPSNLNELLLSVIELDKIPVEKIESMITMCNFQLTLLNNDIQTMTEQDNAYHEEQARLAAEANSSNK
jgi:hypothetical protein